MCSVHDCRHFDMLTQVRRKITEILLHREINCLLFSFFIKERLNFALLKVQMAL